MKKRIQQDIKELRNTLVIAGLNYEIWAFYKEKDNRNKFIDTLRIYKPFFEISLHAHFVAMIIAIYKLFETRSDTVNMHQLIELLKKEGVIPQRKIQKIESKIKEIKPLWVKVSILRNNLFGHRSNTLYFEEIWDKAEITQNKLKKLIDESKIILNEITSLWGNFGHAFNESATQSTMNLLENLKRLNEERL